MLIIGDFGSRKTNALLNLIKEQESDNLIDKIYLYAKDLIKKREGAGIKAFIEYSNSMDDVCNNIGACNPKTERKILIVFD